MSLCCETIAISPRMVGVCFLRGRHNVIPWVPNIFFIQNEYSKDCTVQIYHYAGDDELRHNNLFVQYKRAPEVTRHFYNANKQNGDDK